MSILYTRFRLEFLIMEKWQVKCIDQLSDCERLKSNSDLWSQQFNRFTRFCDILLDEMLLLNSVSKQNLSS
jgi:hypothetical protein